MAVDFIPRTSQLQKVWTAAQFNPWVRGLVLGGTAAYLGYEYLTKDNGDNFPAPVLPSSKPKQKYQEPINPPVKTPLEELADSMKKNVSIADKNFKNVQDNIKTLSENIHSVNTSLHDEVKDSPFLKNQVLSKDTLDAISTSLEKHNVIFSNFFDMVASYADAFLNVKYMEIQNAKVNTDYQKTISAQADMGQFFYEFIPTSEYWAKADTAQILFDARNNWVTMDSNLPSRMYASDEIALIDSLEGYYTNAQIRSKVEDFRKERLGSDIRALIGQTAISQVKDQADTNAKAREYYASASQSLKSKEVPKALSELVTAVAPIAQWADKAKVREEFLSTPSVIKDLDGNTIAQTSPMELSATKDATIAREKTDTINFEVDESDFPLMDFLPVLPFVGREYVFNPDFSLPTANPFTHKTLS